MSEGTGSGRGLIFITGAKLYFIASGFLVQLGLPRLLGSPEVFGQYSLAMSFVSVINNVLIAATVQSVSKRVSEDPSLAGPRLRQGLKLQLGIGALLATGMFLLSPLLARVAYDEKLGRLLQVAALVPLCYALYAALVGSLNGRQLFQRQAALDATFSTVRTAGILGAAALGLGAFGAVSGFAAAAGVILLIALFVVGTGTPGPGISLRAWFGFLLPVVMFQATLNGMLLLDVWVLQNTTAELGLEAGLSLEAASAQASKLVGFYKAGQNFALVPYQVILSVTFVIFPIVSRAIAAGDFETARDSVAGALRFSMIVLLALAAPLGGGAQALIRLAYPQYLAGADALGVLVFGQVALALFVIIATILSGAGRPGVTVGIGLIGLVVVLVANRLLVRLVGLSGPTLIAAAFATSLGTTSALIAASAALKALLKVTIPVKTLARAIAASAVAFYTARLLPQSSPLLAPVVMSAAGIVYLSVLAILGEFTKSDVDAVLAAIRRRKKA